MLILNQKLNEKEHSSYRKTFLVSTIYKSPGINVNKFSNLLRDYIHMNSS